MIVTQDDIRAFVEGNLAPEKAARLFAAMSQDSALRAQIEQEQRLRGTYDGPDGPGAVSSEDQDEAGMSTRPAPSRRAQILDFTAARARREEEAKARAKAERRARRPAVHRMGTGLALLICFVLGTVLGLQLQSQSPVTMRNGALLASGALALALDNRLAASQTPDSQSSPLRILASFRKQNGQFCRVFSDRATGGIACKGTQGWQLDRTTSIPSASRAGGAKDSSDDGGLMTAAQDLAASGPLNADQEKSARARDWMP